MQELTGYKYSIEDVVGVLSKFTPKETNKQKIRIGQAGDGGYVLLDMFNENGIVYSFGVGGSHRFEQDMATRGYTSYMYDHTVSGSSIPKDPHYIFHRKGLAAVDSDNMRSIPTILKENGHTSRNDIILQCDIEGGEWDIFSDIDQKYLMCFSQICIEFHSLNKCILDMDHFKRGRMDHWRFAKMKTTMEALSQNFTAYHIHGNNVRNPGYFKVRGQNVPEVIEVSFVRNDLVEFSEGTTLYPTHLDSANNPKKPDIVLDKFAWNI